MCDYCTKNFNGPTYSIVMDPNGENLSGTFCSLECSLISNRFVCSNNRFITGWEQRQEYTVKVFGIKLDMMHDDGKRKK